MTKKKKKKKKHKREENYMTLDFAILGYDTKSIGN